MKFHRSPKGFTLIELLVVISIIAVLASLAVPAVTSALVKGQLVQAMNNARQIHLATMSMATDGVSTGDSNLGWPGDLKTGTSGITDMKGFVGRLVSYDYLKLGDAGKVFAAAGIKVFNGVDIASFADENCAFKLYWAKDSDSSNTLLLATKNYTYNTAFTVTTDKPFGDKGFVVMRKGGDASILKKQQANSSVEQLVGKLPGATDGTPGSESGDNCYKTAQ
jgi:prepilin-type N-terminal cleavage/methylation domain-containing protein